MWFQPLFDFEMWFYASPEEKEGDFVWNIDVILCVEEMSMIIERLIYVRGEKWDVSEDGGGEKDKDFLKYSFVSF